MARNRVYRHDVRCPGCGSNWMRNTDTRRDGRVTVAEIAGGAARPAGPTAALGLKLRGGPWPCMPKAAA